jgi:hypothetical protein
MTVANAFRAMAGSVVERYCSGNRSQVQGSTFRVQRLLNADFRNFILCCLDWPLSPIGWNLEFDPNRYGFVDLRNCYYTG